MLLDGKGQLEEQTMVVHDWTKAESYIDFVDPDNQDLTFIDKVKTFFICFLIGFSLG